MDRTADDANAERVAFIGLTPKAAARLRGFWPHVEPALPGILADFYAHVRGTGQLAALVGTQEGRLSTAQSRHWARLFSGRFDAEYFASVRQIGTVHARIGLAPRWYIGGYAFVLERLAGLAARVHRFSPAAVAATIGAVTKAVLLDMDLAISVYSDILMQEAEARSARVGNATAGFEREAGEMVGGIAAAATELQGTATSMNELARTAATQANAVAAAAGTTENSVAAVATAAEELTASIAEIARQVAHAARAATEAEARARDTDGVVQALSASARRIGDVVSLIGSIAGQTNLLALNATIEAARAGDAGKGFAVVASEVKNLATQTARATEDISRQIADIQSATDGAVEAIQGIGKMIGQVNEISAAIAAAVEEQGVATEEIARAVQQAAAATREVSASITTVSAGAGTTGAAAAQVLDASGSLSRQSETLNRVVRAFITEIRAA